MEGLIVYICCLYVFLIVLILVSVGAIIAGVSNLVKNKKNEGNERKEEINKSWRLIVFGSIVLLAMIYFLFNTFDPFNMKPSLELNSYGVLSLDDERLVPFLESLNRVDRYSMGFTPIPPYADIEVDGTFDESEYLGLHIYHDNVSRYIRFRQSSDDYKWVSEQEIFYGPDEFLMEAKHQEHIVINYQTESFMGYPINTIFIEYWGDNPNLKHELTLQDVKPIIEEWGTVDY